jgi:excisionase family DNA binding protein
MENSTMNVQHNSESHKAGADKDGGEFPAPLLLRIDDVARLLAISRTAAYRLVGAGELPYVQIDSTRRVPLAALERWIADHTQGGEGCGSKDGRSHPRP